MIEIGGEYLDLTITARMVGGAYVGPILSWTLATEKVHADREVRRQQQMMDQMPINAMLCDISDFTITYANQTSIETLESIEEHLPIKAKDLVGSSIDVFHKNPAHQRKLLSDPANLPWTTKIKVGPETLDLKISAIYDQDGRYTQALLNWSVVTERVRMADNFETNVKAVVDQVSQAANAMNDSSSILLGSAEEALNQTQTVSAATEELTASAREIGSQIASANELTSQAVEKAQRSKANVT